MSGFDSLIGQQELKMRLGRALNELPGHSFVFIGPDGIGKTSFARVFAQALLCGHPTGNGGCGQCPSCRYFEQGTHPDYKELLLQEKEKTIKTDLIRKSVCSDIAMLPQIASRKVYFIDADDINEQGQNTLLKTLEEPPEYAVILLAVSASRNLLPTILSRVIHVPFRRNTAAEIEQILRDRDGMIRRDADRDGSKAAPKNQGTEEGKPFHFLAKFSDGIPGAALRLFESEHFSQLREEVLERMERLPAVSRADLLIDYYSFFEANKSQAEDILGVMDSWIRDLMVYHTCRDRADLINGDKRAAIEKSCPKGPSALDALAAADRTIGAARRGIALNSSFENCICTMLLQLRKELINA